MRPARRLGRWWSLGGLVTLGWAALRACRRLDRPASRFKRTAGEPPGEGESLTFQTKPESRFEDRDEAHKPAARYD